MSESDDDDDMSICDRLENALIFLDETDNDIVPESERVKIAAASVSIMLAHYMITGEKPEDLAERIFTKMEAANG